MLPDEFTTARDDDGHGTHTATTAAGNGGVAASIFGVPRGIVSGIAPRAHVIAYKVCGDLGCFGCDSAAAVQQAIRDGVNVINFSISGGTNPYSDAVELAFLDAYDAGVFVAASAGNSGPAAETTDHRGPWVTTVAASTQNRVVREHRRPSRPPAARPCTLDRHVDHRRHRPGRRSSVRRLMRCASARSPPGSVRRQDRRLQARRRPAAPRRATTSLQGGAVGMILYNKAANVTDLETDNHFLPASPYPVRAGRSQCSPSWRPTPVSRRL